MTDADQAKQPETYFNFTGMKASGNFKQLPALGDRMEFRIVAECNVEPHLKLMKDGHRRPLVGMNVMEIEPGEITRSPKDDQLPFDEADEPAVGDDDEDDDEDGADA